MAQSSTSNSYRPGRTVIVFAVVVLCLYILMAVTHSWTPRLGLDLRGGTTITLTARSADGSSTVPRENLETARTIIQNRVDSLGVGEASVTIQGDNQIEVAVPNVNSDELVELVGTTARLNFRQVIAYQPVETAQTEVSTTPDPDATSDAVGDESESNASAETTDEASTTSESSTSVESTDETSPSASSTAEQRGPAPQLPTEPPAPASPRPTTTSGVEMSVEEKLDYSPTEQDVNDFLAFTCGDDFPDVEDQPLIACSQDGTAKYLLGPVLISGDHVTDANAGIPQGQLQWVVNLSFDSEGATLFSDSTAAISAEQSPQNAFAIVLDREVVSAPTVSERIANGSAQISGGSIDEDGARNLATVLRYGSLPVDLETSSVDTVSPTLGGNQMTAGVIAGIIGLALVVVYSLVYYRGLTIVVVGSLISAALLTYAVIVLLGSAVGFALNLPGIAGAIVAIGVTADSFIVYFERIRDEIRDGHRLRHAIESGWKKARGTILMADGVQILAALVLYFLAIGAVKGFAFTLGVTTAIDLILVLFFTHPLMSILGRTKFFGEGHKFSGFDPEHIGVTRSSMLGRRAHRASSKKTHASTHGQESTND